LIGKLIGKTVITLHVHERMKGSRMMIAPGRPPGRCAVAPGGSAPASPVR
jgi:hypothetical protein